MGMQHFCHGDRVSVNACTCEHLLCTYYRVNARYDEANLYSFIQIEQDAIPPV